MKGDAKEVRDSDRMEELNMRIGGNILSGEIACDGNLWIHKKTGVV